jgi:hypothetical protein
MDGDEDLEVRADAGVVSGGGSGLSLIWARARPILGPIAICVGD